LKKIYLKYLSIRLLEGIIILFSAVLWILVFSVFFGHLWLWIILFSTPVFIYIIHTFYLGFSRKRLARYLERHNNLDEYLISFVELQKSQSKFVPILEKRLKTLLKNKKIRVPVNKGVVKSAIFSLIFLEVFVLVFSSFDMPFHKVAYFDRVEYKAFPGEAVQFSVKGTYIPENVIMYSGKSYILNKMRGLLFLGKPPTIDTVRVPINNGSGVVNVPKHTGIYLISCDFCVPARIKVLNRPVVRVRGYVETSSKKRKLLPVDYLLTDSKITLDLSFVDADSIRIGLCDKNLMIFRDTVISFRIRKTCKVNVRMYTCAKPIDTTLYTIHIVNDLPPGVVVLYPSKAINPVMSDTVHVVAYIYDDIALDRVFVLLYREGYKRLIFEKKYHEATFDTLRLQVADILGGSDEVKMRIIAVDAGGKETYRELTYRKPSYEDRLKEFMAIADSIRGNENGLIGVDELKKIDFSLRERQDLNLEEREKLKVSLEKTFKEVKKIEEQIEQMKNIVDNLQEVVQDKELMKTMEEFNRTFAEILKEHFSDLLKRISEVKRRVDTMNRKDLENYLEKLNANRKEVIKELRKLKEFMDLLKKELDREEFVSRFERLFEQEKYLKDKTMYLEDIKPLAEEQMRLLKSLDSLKRLSPELWEKYKEEFGTISKQMKNISGNLKNNKRRISLKQEERALKAMGKMTGTLRKELRKHRERQKQALVERIKRLKNDLYFLNLINVPEMDNHQRGIYKESLKFIMNYVDSFDAITYVSIFKAVALLRLASEFIVMRPVLAYGLVNQAIYFLLKKQKGMKRSGQGGAGEELRRMLERLLQRQSGLTKQSEGILPVPLPSNSGLNSLLEEYGRMQEKLRKMAEKLAKMAEDEGVKGELARALKEMKKAEEDLKSGHISSETIKHQRKALQHLLKAYRSVRKRDVARKRVSTPGKAFIPDVPPVPRVLIVEQKLDSLLRQSILKGYIRDSFMKMYIKNLRKLEK